MFPDRGTRPISPARVRPRVGALRGLSLDEHARYNAISAAILGSAIKIHRAFGPGLLESVYREVLAYELEQLGFAVMREVPVPLVYGGKTFPVGFRADLVVAGLVLVELKSVEALNPAHFRQVTTYLRLSSLRLGLLINFNEATLLRGFHRIAA